MALEHKEEDTKQNRVITVFARYNRELENSIPLIRAKLHSVSILPMHALVHKYSLFQSTSWVVINKTGPLV